MASIDMQLEITHADELGRATKAHPRERSRIVHDKVVGQERLRPSLLVALIAGGHILLESVPGLAKTTAAHRSPTR